MQAEGSLCRLKALGSEDLLDDLFTEANAGELFDGHQTTGIDDVKLDNPGVSKVQACKLDALIDKKFAYLTAIGQFLKCQVAGAEVCALHAVSAVILCRPA